MYKHFFIGAIYEAISKLLVLSHSSQGGLFPKLRPARLIGREWLSQGRITINMTRLLRMSTHRFLLMLSFYFIFSLQGLVVRLGAEF